MDSNDHPERTGTPQHHEGPGPMRPAIRLPQSTAVATTKQAGSKAPAQPTAEKRPTAAPRKLDQGVDQSQTQQTLKPKKDDPEHGKGAPKIMFSAAALQLPTPSASRAPSVRSDSPTDTGPRSRLASTVRSVGVVAPISPTAGSGTTAFDFTETGHPAVTDPNAPKVYLPPAAAALLAKFKPFDKKAALRLQARISERKKRDREKTQKRALEEAKLVDGQLVVDDDDEEKLEEDPKLAEGKALPKAVANHFPKHMLGVPIEDVDQRNREYEETFLVISRRFNKYGYIYRFSATPSAWLFKPWNPLRKLAIYCYTHPLFDIIVIFTILANSVYMAMNVDEAVPEYTFLAIYTLEGVIKAISRGIILSEHTYLRDPWNWLDFLVLISAYATIIAQYSAGSSNVSSSLKGLKALRVFRVLKTVALIPGLKTIIEALIRALKMLGDVLIMTVLFFTVFALFGNQIFQGTLQTKCVRDADIGGFVIVNDTNSSSLPNAVTWDTWVYNQSNWFMQDDQWEFMVCGNTSGAQGCPKNYTCLSLDGTPNPNNDFTKFDNFFNAFMVALQLFNTDYWDFLYHAVIAANGPAAFIFFVVGILFLNFYLANLVQAVVALSYEVEEDDDDDDAPEVVKTARKMATNRRFVFDPTRLRLILVGPDARTVSLRSVRNVTERKLSTVQKRALNNVAPAVTVNYADDEPMDDFMHDSNGKPVAVVKPQQLSSMQQKKRPQVDDMDEDEKPSTVWPGAQNTIRYRTASRPPSAVDDADLPKIGFWDRNPMCCFKCCIGFFPWLKIQYGLYVFVTDPFFDLFITAAIAINTISMAANYYQIPDDIDNLLSTVNDVCTYIFITEAVLKLTCMCGEYFDNRWNWLDLIVVIGSLLDIVMSNINISFGGFNIQIIRLLRLLRILKLAQSWKTMRTLLEIIFGTFSAILNLLVVLVIVMFVFAIIGMQIFGGTYTVDKFPGFPGPQGFTPFPGFQGIPEFNFDDFFHAFMLVFRILCRETWQPMLDCMITNNMAICIVYFLATLLIGSYVVLNLFLAVLLNAFNADEMKKISKDEEDTKLKKRFRAIKHWLRDLFAKCRSKPKPNVTASAQPSEQKDDGITTVQGDDDDTEADPKTGKSVRLNIPGDDGSDNDNSPDDDQKSTRSKTGPGSTTGGSTTAPGGTTARSTARSTVSGETNIENSRVRDCCWPFFDKKFPALLKPFAFDQPLGKRIYRARTIANDICNNRWFEWIILAFIFASSITLCIQDANLEDDSEMGIALQYLDYLYLAVFTVELFIKLFAQGIRVYFTSAWTLLDFFIVATGFVDIIISEMGNGVNLSALRALRTLRALRPLRAISRWQGMKIVVNALITAIPGIINVLLVVLIIWLIFAIMGVQFFAGKFWMCVDRGTGNRTAKALVPNRATCESLPEYWQWSYYLVNYDNVAYSYLALFQVGTFEGWTTIFQMSVDSPENIGDQPAPELNIYYYIYYIVFIVLCSFFLLNLFVGVIIDDFNALKKKYEGGTALTLFMTDSQKKYYQTISKLGSKKPRKTVVKPTNATGLFMFNIANSSRFEFAIAFAIFGNIIAMATEHYNQDITYTVSQDMLNFIFTTIFTLEAALKLYGLRLFYFRTAWNDFDFAIVLISIMSILLTDLMSTDMVISPSLLRILRVLRVARILRLIRASKGVRKLMASLMMSLPALLNIGSLLFLIIFIFAIIGMNLFGHVGHFGGNLDDVVNFHTFPSSLLTLFRLTTISGWDNIHQGLSFTDDPAIGCMPGLDMADKDYARSNPCCNRTAWMRPNGNIVLETGGMGNCGNVTLASVFIIAYLLFTYFIIVNMFAAVILDNYQQATQQEDIGVTDDDIERFYSVWETYDPLATQFIKYQDLSNFVAALDPPLQCSKPNEHTMTLLDLPILRDNKTGEEIIHCLDVLMGLVQKALGSLNETEDFTQVKDNLEAMFKKTFPNRVQVQKVCTTKLRKKQDVAAKTLQRAYRNWKAGRNLRQAARARVQSISIPNNSQGSSFLPGVSTKVGLLAVPQTRK